MVRCVVRVRVVNVERVLGGGGRVRGLEGKILVDEVWEGEVG